MWNLGRRNERERCRTVYSLSGIRGKTEWMSDGNVPNIVSIL
jgi:hypothetical protein